jgi:hypothetical protein
MRRDRKIGSKVDVWRICTLVDWNKRSIGRSSTRKSTRALAARYSWLRPRIGPRSRTITLVILSLVATTHHILTSRACWRWRLSTQAGIGLWVPIVCGTLWTVFDKGAIWWRRTRTLIIGSSPTQLNSCPRRPTTKISSSVSRLLAVRHGNGRRRIRIANVARATLSIDLNCNHAKNKKNRKISSHGCKEKEWL